MEENNRKETMESLFDEESLGVVRRGTLVKGKVVGVGQQDVFVDIGYKAEGVIPISEFDKVPSVGDEVEAIVKRFSSDGTIVLSKLEVDMKKKLESIEKAMVTGEPVFGRIKE
ncbi:MAG: S1 RNA-binding domain-containing protein, partial [candidate division WOR-3 bacterium]